MYEGLISVIVPVYKVELYLRQCIESIMTQSYQNIEIILVDDGSPDDCPTICDEYAATDARIKVIHKENGGLVSARRAGALVATGEYVVCVDGDDWITKNCIEKFADAIGKDAPDIVMCGAIYAYGDHDTEKPISYRKGYYTREQIVEEIFPILIQSKNATYFPPSIWAKAYRTELYQRFQQTVDERIKIGEDSACVIPCIYHASSLAILPECTYYYRQNQSSMTKEKKAFAWNGPLLIHRQLEEQLDLEMYHLNEQLQRKTTHELFSVVVSQFYRKEPYRTIVSEIKKNLEEPVYRDAIKQSSFTGKKARFMHFALKHRWFWLVWLYSVVKP